MKAWDRRELHPVTLRQVHRCGWWGSSHSKPWRALNTGPEVRGGRLGRQEWKANIMHHCPQWACRLQKHGKHSYTVYLGTRDISWNETITNSWRAKMSWHKTLPFKVCTRAQGLLMFISTLTHEVRFWSLRLELLLPFRWNENMYEGRHEESGEMNLDKEYTQNQFKCTMTLASNLLFQWLVPVQAHLGSGCSKWPWWTQGLSLSWKWHFPLVANMPNWGLVLYSFLSMARKLSVKWQMGQKKRRGHEATHPPVSAVKGLCSNHLHMTTWPAPRLNSECLMRPLGTPLLVFFFSSLFLFRWQGYLHVFGVEENISEAVPASSDRCYWSAPEQS